MFKNTKIITKIIVALVLLVMGMFIISSASYQGLNSVGSEIEEIAEYQMPLSKVISALEKDILREEILTNEIIIASKDVSSNEFSELEDHIMSLEKKTDSKIQECVKLAEKAIEHSHEMEIKDKYKSFLKTCSQLEKMQKKFEHSLKEFEHNIENGILENVNDEKDVLHRELAIMDGTISKLLVKMEDLLTESTLKAESDEHMALRTIEWIFSIVFIFALLIGFFLIKTLKNSLSIFQVGLLSFFQYLNKEIPDSKLIEMDSNDEIGIMAKVVNANITKTKDTIDSDNAFLQEVSNIILAIKEGHLDKRLDHKVTSENLEELRGHMNDMLENLQQKVCTNINDVSAALDNYAKLDFRYRVQGCNGEVTMGLNNLADIITDMLVENKENGLTLDVSSNVLLTNVNKLNESSNEAAASLEETAAAIEEITSNIRSNTENIAKMSNYSNEVTLSANEGEKLATQTTSAMEEIDSQVVAINEAITDIDHIALKTNIFSYNAAVEAATAGEAGKGFAVVAQEVRNLASRSAEAAKEIKGLVETATLKANNGKSIAGNMIAGYQSLNENISQTIRLISDIEGASKEQLLGIEQINDAVNQLDQQTQENAMIANQTQDISSQTDTIAKMIVNNANEKEFNGKDEVQAKSIN